jgi:uncharacterized protein (TIGR02246 family)
MPAYNPNQVHRAFTQAFNSGDIDAVMALYEPDACCIEPEPGTLAEGWDAVREVVKAFLALKGQITFDTKKVVQAGNLAVLHGEWSLAGTGPDGSPVSLAGTTTEVVRKQPDGTWLYVIDLPDDV